MANEVIREKIDLLAELIVDCSVANQYYMQHCITRGSDENYTRKMNEITCLLEKIKEVK